MSGVFWVVLVLCFPVLFGTGCLELGWVSRCFPVLFGSGYFALGWVSGGFVVGGTVVSVVSWLVPVGCLACVPY